MGFLITKPEISLFQLQTVNIPDRLSDAALLMLKPTPLSPNLVTRKKQKEIEKEGEEGQAMLTPEEEAMRAQGEGVETLEAAAEAEYQAVIDAHTEQMHAWTLAVAEKAALVEISRKADQRNEAIATYLKGNSAIYIGAAETHGTIIEIEKHDIVLDEDGDCSSTVIYIAGKEIGNLPLEVKWWTGAIDERGRPVRVDGEIHLTDWGGAHRYTPPHTHKTHAISLFISHPPIYTPPATTHSILHPPT